MIPMISIYACATVVIAAILAWRYKREPEKGVLLLVLLAMWLAIPIIIFAMPHGWVPVATPGHPSWLSIVALALLASALIILVWRRPPRWRRDVFIFGPLIVLLFVVQILYPLFWQH